MPMIMASAYGVCPVRHTLCLGPYAGYDVTILKSLLGKSYNYAHVLNEDPEPSGVTSPAHPHCRA